MCQRLEIGGIDFELCQTTFAGDATERTRNALQAGYETIAVVGGDGTLSEAAEGFFQFPVNSLTPAPVAINPAAALAIIPAGTGDDFARGLTHNRAPLKHWLELLVSHCQKNSDQTARRVDVMAAKSDGASAPFVCLNASTMGIGGETGARVAAQGQFMRKFSGEARFLAAAIGALAAWRERQVRITVDAENVFEARMNLVAVANGIYAGGGMMLSPRALIDDGKLDVVSASGLNRLQVMRELPRIHRGGHVTNPKVRIVQGRCVRIETFSPDDALLIEADGNLRGRTPVEFQIVPSALKVVAS